METTQEKAPDGHATSETALELRPQDFTPSPYEPASLDQARALARDFTTSKLTRCRTPEQALLVMATGRELGIPATTALRMIYIADFGQGDTITLSADLMVALCLRSPICEYFRCTETTNERATYAAKRKGDPERTVSFTSEDKERAQLGLVGAGKDARLTNWAKYPSVMLRHRAASMLAREVFPDVIGGFYTDDEAAEVAARVLATPVLPLPVRAEDGPGAEEVQDAEIVESDEVRIVRLFGEATKPSALKPLVDEALKLWPKERPGAVSAAHKAAKARIAQAATATVLQQAPPTAREPGAEG